MTQQLIRSDGWKKVIVTAMILAVPLALVVGYASGPVLALLSVAACFCAAGGVEYMLLAAMERQTGGPQAVPVTSSAPSTRPSGR